MNTKKILSTLLATLLVLCLSAGCAKGGETSTEATSSASVSQETTTSRVIPTSVTPIYPGEESVAEWDEYTDEVEFPSEMKEVKFTGKKSDKIVSEEYTYYVGQKYVLLIDKNVELPGNYNTMVDDILDTMERISGLSFTTDRKTFYKNMCPTNSGEYPWDGIKTGNKYIIQLNYKVRSNYFDGPDCRPGYVILTDSGMDTLPGYEVIECDYHRMMSEMSMALFYNYYPNMASSNNADGVLKYYVVETLEEKYNDLKRLYNELGIEHFKSTITAENVEEVWVSSHLYYDDWYEEKAVEELFIHYMLDTYGDKFFTTFLSTDSSLDAMTREQQAALLKEKFGEDVFVKYYEWVVANSPERPGPIDLTGRDPKGTFVSDKNYYVEGEYCFIYIEEGLLVPNNIVEICDTIVKTLQEKMWGETKPLVYPPSMASDNGTFCGISNNNKLPIVFRCDKDDMGYISTYWDPDVRIYDWGMNTGDMSEFEYETIAHECSHAVLDEKIDNSKVGKAICEGSAEYFAKVVTEELGYGDVWISGFYYHTPITSKTAEEIFRNDFSDVGHADRGAEYAFGCYLSEYLQETFGDQFLTMIKDGLMDLYIHDTSSGYGDDTDRAARTEAMKKIFGDDVFEKFGAWCEQNK